MKYICSDYAIKNCLAINKNIDNEKKLIKTSFEQILNLRSIFKTILKATSWENYR